MRAVVSRASAEEASCVLLPKVNGKKGRLEWKSHVVVFVRPHIYFMR
jgi:hypothetical protein